MILNFIMVRILFNLFNKLCPVTGIIPGIQLNERKRKKKRKGERKKISWNKNLVQILEFIYFFKCHGEFMNHPENIYNICIFHIE